jgi:ribosomal-protein-alanine acetyltransferase
MGAPLKRRPNGRLATAGRYRIRPAEAADVPAVHAIEQASFTDPWPARDFRECVASEVLFLVAAAPDGVEGYVIAQDAADEGEILNLAVAAPRHRGGIGRALVERVLATLALRGVKRVFLEVRESNVAARALYASLGFEEVGRRSRYYRRPVEDAIVLRAAIPADGGDA